MSSSPSELGRLGLTVVALERDAADKAFILARLNRPELNLQHWHAFVAAWRDDAEGRGILSVRNQRGSILGFAAWWLQPDLDHGTALWAEPLMVREVGVRPLVQEALLRKLWRMAIDAGAGLRVVRPEPPPPPNQAPQHANDH